MFFLQHQRINYLRMRRIQWVEFTCPKEITRSFPPSGNVLFGKRRKFARDHTKIDALEWNPALPSWKVFGSAICSHIISSIVAQILIYAIQWACVSESVPYTRIID